MPATKIENPLASVSVRHRALCEEGDYKGPWRATADEAFGDARGHRSKPGNEAHSIRIESEQRVSLRFEG
jgi:hypothetical protein